MTLVEFLAPLKDSPHREKVLAVLLFKKRYENHESRKYGATQTCPHTTFISDQLEQRNLVTWSETNGKIIGVRRPEGCG